MRKALAVLASISALGLAGALAAGCGSSNSTSGTTATSTPATTTTQATTTAPTSTKAAQTVAISAEATSLAFDKTAITVTAGDVTFDFTNPGAVPHNLSIRSADGTDVGATDTVTGTSSSPAAAAPLTVTLKPGTYTFYCSVDGHEAAGMKGTLTVK